MEVKMFEVLDAATFIPVVAILMESEDPDESYLLMRSGYQRNSNLVVLLPLTRMKAEYDPHRWTGSRTFQVAHAYIAGHWDTLKSGQVVDVEYILEERDTPKPSEKTLH